MNTRHRIRAAGAALAAAMAFGALSACSGAISSGVSTERGTCQPDEVQLVQSGRGLENEYYVAVNTGAKAFAASQGMSDRYHWISSGGDSSRQLGQIKSLLAKYGSCTVLNVDANESSIVPAIVKAVDQAGAWLVTQWNKPDAVSPQTSGIHWVAHMSVNGVPQGYETAKVLFEHMGGEGNIVALQGILDNPPAKERFRGLQKALAEYPGITLLADQSAGWDRTTAQNTTQTWLTKYGDQIGGVWAAGDDMALGALEALKNGGHGGGAVPVTGVDGLTQAIELVGRPDSGYVATTESTGARQGAVGLEIGLAAATGRIDPATEPAARRSFYLKPLPVITAANVATAPRPMDTDNLNFTDLWADLGGPIA